MESDRESSQVAHVHKHRWARPGQVCTHADGEAWLPPQHQAPRPPGRRHDKVGHARPTPGIPGSLPLSFHVLVALIGFNENPE